MVHVLEIKESPPSPAAPRPHKLLHVIVFFSNTALPGADQTIEQILQSDGSGLISVAHCYGH